MTTRHFSAAAGLVLLLASCDFDVQNPNSPEPIGSNPSRPQVAASATGLLIGSRGYIADWILDIGIMGREAYRFDGSDPRFTTELLGQDGAVLDAGSGAFGGDHWFEMYRNVRSANALLAVIGTAQALTAAEQDAVRGFAHTMQALDLLFILNARTQDSIPLDVGTDPTAPPAPFATRAAAFARIETLLDQAQTELQNGGASFPFQLTSGFAGFDTPTTFIQFNRALKARVNAYQGDWAEVLTDLAGSFIDPGQSLDLGVYHTFSTGAGDINNTIHQSVVENYAHPQLADSAQLQVGGAPDDRFVRKTFSRPSNTTGGLTSNLGLRRYEGPASSIPIIRNEELLLLRAEANIGLNTLGPALTDLNTVRTTSGLLPGYVAFADSAEARNALLYERRYSLLFEGGHRWLDMRRYNRLNQLPIDRPGDLVFSTFPVPTDEVLARQ
jgi:hypothetical protein